MPAQMDEQPAFALAAESFPKTSLTLLQRQPLSLKSFKAYAELEDIPPSVKPWLKSYFVQDLSFLVYIMSANFTFNDACAILKYREPTRNKALSFQGLYLIAQWFLRWEDGPAGGLRERQREWALSLDEEQKAELGIGAESDLEGARARGGYHPGYMAYNWEKLSGKKK